MLQLAAVDTVFVGGTNEDVVVEAERSGELVTKPDVEVALLSAAKVGDVGIEL